MPIGTKFEWQLNGGVRPFGRRQRFLVRSDVARFGPVAAIDCRLGRPPDMPALVTGVVRGLRGIAGERQALGLDGVTGRARWPNVVCRRHGIGDCTAGEIFRSVWNLTEPTPAPVPPCRLYSRCVLPGSRSMPLLECEESHADAGRGIRSASGAPNTGSRSRSRRNEACRHGRTEHPLRFPDESTGERQRVGQAIQSLDGGPRFPCGLEPAYVVMIRDLHHDDVAIDRLAGLH